jgi:hypothetical protein
VLYNPGADAVVHTPAPDWPGTMRLYRSGQHFRPDWVPDPAAEPEPEYLTNGQAVTLQPKAHVVIENTTASLSSGIFNHSPILPPPWTPPRNPCSAPSPPAGTAIVSCAWKSR